MTTQIVWDAEYEEFKCTKCNAYFQYNFGFKYCPMCRRRVERSDKRQPETPHRALRSVLRR